MRWSRPDARGARGAWPEAASALEAAARHTADPESRARRAVEAAGALLVVGRMERAHALVEEALDRSGDPLLRADASLLRGQLEIFRGSPLAAHEILVGAAAAVELVDPARAARLMFEAVPPLLLSGRFDQARRTAERALTLDERAGGSEPGPALTLGGALVALGEAREGGRHIREGAARLRAEEMLANPHDVSCLIFLAWVEEYDSARELLDGAILAARAAGAPTALPLALGHRSEVALRAGDLATAQVTASEAVRLAEETGQAFYLTFLLVCLARVEALEDGRPTAERT